MILLELHSVRGQRNHGFSPVPAMAHFIGHHGIRNSSSGATRRNSTHSSSSRPGEHDTRDTVTDQRPDFYLNDNQDDYDDYSTGSRPSLLGEDQLPPNALKVLVNDNSDSHEPPQQKKPSDSDSSLIVPTSRPGLTGELACVYLGRRPTHNPLTWDVVTCIL